ncbi:MAG: OmpP1/FadL family transporter [Bacteroidales bacterium]
MKRYMSIVAVLMAVTINLSAQNEDDALRYSYLTFGGTARSMGVGGAFGALGADFSTLSTNPAGIGLYKQSEFTFSPSLYVGKTSSIYQGKSMDDLRYNFNLGNLGMVLSFPAHQSATTSGWKNVQFGLGINRTNNFNNRMVIDGNNTASSMLDAWTVDAGGQNYDNLSRFDLGLAFDTWLLDTIAGDPYHYKNAAPAGGVMQRKSVNEWGSMNEWVMSLGANYNDKFYIGATMGFPFLKYSLESSYSETALASDIAFEQFRKFTYNENLVTEGSGFNFKFGMIFKPVDFIRIGASIHTPTYFYNMSDTYSSVVKSEFDNGDSFKEESPEGKYDYKLNTPMRATGSIAFIIGKFGLLSADYEFVDYSESRFRSKDADVYFEVNDAIRMKYTATSNIRLGTEWRYNQFNFRGGYALYGSPFKSDINDAARTSYTFGIGIRETDYFLDFAYIFTQSKQDYYLYSNTNVPLNPAYNETTNQNFIMTLGFKF